jgi:hypothetical protein
MLSVHPQVLKRNGKKQFAVLPYDEFNRLMERLADYEDLRLLREAKAKEKNVPGIGLDELKRRLGIRIPAKRSSRRRRKRI